MRTELNSTGDVIDALGGRSAMQRITGSKDPRVVSNWRARKRFPPDTFLVLSSELQKRGLTAPPSLWGIVEPEQRAAS